MHVCRFVWGCINMWLLGEGRRDWEVDLRYGVKEESI